MHSTNGVEAETAIKEQRGELRQGGEDGGSSGNGAGASAPVARIPSPTDGVNMARLVGVPHLFGRMKQLRDGVLIEPISVLTMQPGGRITGYSHPNEGTWVPYEHGPVSGDEAFAFLTANNTWIPSSTWTQSMGDIPIGHFCDEPEMSAAVQRMCLVPQVPLPPKTKIIYLVATCLRFQERTMPQMLAQLDAEGIERSRIKVVVNGCAKNENRVIDGIDYAFSTHDAWEWSALYEAPLRWKFDYGFLIHDTSVIFAGFRRNVEAVNGHVKWDHLPATPMARCLLGLYSHDFLMRCNGWLQSLDHVDKKNGVMAEVGAELLLRARSALVIGDPEFGGGARGAEWREVVDYYNTGSPRVRRVFPAIKVHKFIHTGSTHEKQL